MKRKSTTNIFDATSAITKTKAPNIALSDFIAPKILVKGLYGCFCVTTGFGVDEGGRIPKDLDDYNSIMVKALADRFAEAFAEYLHEKYVRNLGYSADEVLTAE
jgi:5-methyltetrahydrofolate--homocysteine methyltransferase